MGRATGLVIALVLWGAGQVAVAQDIRPYRVTVLGPAMVYTNPIASAQNTRTPRLSYPRLTQELARSLAADPRMELVTQEEMQRSARSALGQDSASYVNFLRDRGVEEFALYEIGSAIDTLREAVESYEELGAWYTQSADVAMAYEYLARAYLERAAIAETPDGQTGALAQARRAFKALIRLRPNADIRPGLFPPPVVSLFREAYVELLFEEGRALAMPSDRAQDLIDLQDLDYLVFPYFLRDDDGVRLVVQVLDASSTEVFREVVPLPDDPNTSLDRVSWAISSFIACLPLRREAPVGPVAVDAGHLFLKAGWAFMFYGEKPTDEAFLNQGVSLQLDYQVTENFGAFARTSILFGDRDPAGDLIDGFDSVRTSLGIVLSIRFRWLRFWLGTGLEYNRVGSYRATEEFWCKVSGGAPANFDEERDCRPAEVDSVPSSNLFGPYLMPGVSIELITPFSLYVNGNFGFYISDSADVDFPLSGEGGIEYRF